MNPGKLTAQDAAAAPFTEGKTIRKLSDGAGLFLQIDGRSKAWRFRYVGAGKKDALMSLGVYPTVSLEQARAKAAEARARIARGEDPQAARQKERDQKWLKTAKTFGVVSAEYNATQAHRGQKTRDRSERMRRYSVKLHNRMLGEFDRPILLQCCRVFELAGKRETAHRLGVYFTQVFRYAFDEGYYAGANPTNGGFGKSLKPVQETHHLALTKPADVGNLITAIDSWEWLDISRGIVGAVVGRALQMLARTAVRPGELRGAEWSEFNLASAIWTIPLHRMKMRDGNRTDHVVPLSRQACAVLEAQKDLTGHGKYVFPNARSDMRPLTGAALTAALVALGYKGQHVPHGFRTTFKTLSLDTLKVEMELVERQLAHKWGSDAAGAYDKAQRLDERRVLMQQYSDLLDKLRG